MPDNQTTPVQQTMEHVANHINVSEPWAVAHWARLLGITKQQLLAAVHQVGPSVTGVKQYLKL